MDPLPSKRLYSDVADGVALRFNVLRDRARSEKLPRSILDELPRSISDVLETDDVDGGRRYTP